VSSRHERTLARLAAANPVPEPRVALLVPASWREEVLGRILASQPVPIRERPTRDRRVIVAIAVLLALLVLPAYAIAQDLVDDWLTGEPAPQSVVENFDSYTPQLGFQPASGRAVRVAVDWDVALYATTNDRGTYCVATSTPDGGICVRPATAAAPLAAGIMPGDPARAHPAPLVVAGRAADPAARAVRFTDRDGSLVEKPLGTSGFFVAALPLRGSPCADGDWVSRFEALGAAGDVLATARITLAREGVTSGGSGVCTWANGPHQ
jgi:hypothetical protein